MFVQFVRHYGPVLMAAILVLALTQYAQGQAPLNTVFSCAETLKYFPKRPLTRLVCADAELSKLFARQWKVYAEDANKLAGADFDAFANQYRGWTTDLQNRCGLIGKEDASLDQLMPAKACVEQSIRARLASLSRDKGVKGAPATGSRSKNAEQAIWDAVEKGIRPGTETALRLVSVWDNYAIASLQLPKQNTIQRVLLKRHTPEKWAVVAIEVDKWHVWTASGIASFGVPNDVAAKLATSMLAHTSSIQAKARDKRSTVASGAGPKTQEQPPPPPANCEGAREALERLICADTSLSKLAGDLERAQSNSHPREIQDWTLRLIRDCGLVGKNAAPPQELLAASKSCVAKGISSRIAALSKGKGDIAPPPGPDGKGDGGQLAGKFTPVHIVTVTMCPGCSGEPTKQATFGEMRFHMSDGLKGKVWCKHDEEVKIALDFDAISQRILINDNHLVIPTLNRIRNATLYECQNALKTGNLIETGLVAWGQKRATYIPKKVVFSSTSPYLAMFSAYAPGHTEPWIVQQNVAREQELQRQAQIRAQQEAELQHQRAAQARQDRRSAFLSKYGVKHLINEEMLTVNPFVYKDQVVGVHTTFGRMIAMGEALFHHDGVGTRAIIVTGVPLTYFAGAKPVVLALKVLGTKAFRTPTGEAILPHGQYVGVFECQNSRCDEFYDY